MVERLSEEQRDPRSNRGYGTVAVSSVGNLKCAVNARPQGLAGSIPVSHP